MGWGVVSISVALTLVVTTCARGPPLLADCGTPQLLIVIGSVTRSTARILLELSPESHHGTPPPCAVDKLSEAVEIRLWGWTGDRPPNSNHRLGDPDVVVTSTASSRPTITVVTGLVHNTKYWGYVARCPRRSYPPSSSTSSPPPCPGGLTQLSSDHEMWFTTAPTTDARNAAVKAAFVSCHRFLEDRDPGLIPALNGLWPPPHVTVHLGDQIYSDSIAKRVRPSTTHAELLAMFRTYYRRAWLQHDMHLMLRRGSHVMLPDDHDIFSNLGATTTYSRLQKKVIRAGLQAYYEYQGQLHIDIPAHKLSIHDHCGVECDSVMDLITEFPVYGVLQWGPLSLLLLDTRLERHKLANSKAVIGKRQQKWLASTLHKNTAHNTIIASAVPLLYMSPTAAHLADRWENEQYPTSKYQVAEADFVLDTILEHIGDPDPRGGVRSLLVAGDLHHYAQGVVCSQERPRCIHQLLTSGLTEGSTVARSGILHTVFTLNAHVMNPSTPRHVLTHNTSLAFLGMNALHVDATKRDGLSWEAVQEPPGTCPSDGGLCPKGLGWVPLVRQVAFHHFPALLSLAVVVLPGATMALAVLVRKLWQK